MLVENCEKKKDAGPMSDIFDSQVNNPSFDEFSVRDKRSTKKKKGGLRRD
jgi:hypothetical protein